MASRLLTMLLLVALMTPVFMHINSKSVTNNVYRLPEREREAFVNTSSVRLSATRPPEPDDPYHSNEKEPGLYPAEDFLPGKYRNLNSAELMKSILPSVEGDECPALFEVARLTPVVNGVLDLVYDTDLKVNDYQCSSEPEATNHTYIHPYPTNLKPDGELPSTVFHGVIPNETVTCGEVGALPETFMSFMEVKMLLDQFLVTYPGQHYEPEKYGIHSKYYLYLGINDTTCIYLKEKDVDAMVALIYKKISNGIYESASNGSASEGADYGGNHPQEINVEELLQSQIDLRQLCPCSAHFPKNITLLPASDMNGEKVRQTQGPVDGGIPQKEEVDTMPMPILWEGQRCPKKQVYSLEDIVSDRDHMLRSNKLGNLMFHGVVEKLFDEIRPEIRSFLPKVLTFETKRRILLEQGTGLEGMRAVMNFKGGSSCGSMNITEDVVVLLEVFHILHQLSNSIFMKELINDTQQWETILREEAFKKKSVTMHLFRRNATSNLEVCTYTASRRAIELLAPTCEQFTPLGGTDPAKIPLAETHNATHNASSPHPQRPNSTVHDKNNSEEQSIPEPGGGESQNENLVEDKPQPTASPTTSDSQQPVKTDGDEADSEDDQAIEDNSNAAPSPSASATPSSSASPSLTNSSASVSPSASTNSTETTTTGVLDDSACFPSLAQVLLADGTLKALQDLKVGDYIRDGEGEYSRVLLFAHANPDVMSSFVLLNFNSGALPISAKHYLPVNGNLLTAESVKVGDRISLLHMNPSYPGEWTTVTEIGHVSMKGLYNPQTSSGSMAVFWKGQPVITSTYTSSLDPVLAHIMMWPLRWLDHNLGYVLPFCSQFLRNGSAFWHRVLPRGPTCLHV
ncbi:Indian hedgehog B protein [Gracilariopsis chorda]|uniref:Indian hedgehog B protein n=1 Tax=Gracilariopsis chorda TaxID=448386 RepID=A0A2V3IYD5_9FLOR|nr:Indian hedgehog B protein [Gracilariopsis chorda]|eukprot:PXF47131.1 Indian hedgehog B protein [Gracilariopsis chorda]